MRTVAHLYDTYEIAAQVAQALESAGFAHDSVSVVANQGSSPGLANVPAYTGAGTLADPAYGAGDAAMAPNPVTGTAAETNAGTGGGTGASIGTLLGGGAGLLAGIGALAIPGVGPVVAAGWLVATLTGAGAGAGLGGLVGALTGSGVKDEHAHVYAEGVRRGSTLVTVRADDARAAEAETIMLGHGPVDIAGREASYRADDGWTGFDDSRSGLTAEELQAERLRASRTPI